jgi:hypothetical protein
MLVRTQSVIRPVRTWHYIFGAPTKSIAYVVCPRTKCRVEEWRGSLGHAATPRFHSPLIEPDGPSYGIRLSDKTSDLRPREAVSKRPQLDESQRAVEVLVPKASRSRVADLVLVA